jgi:CRISPR-associated protein Csh2
LITYTSEKRDEQLRDISDVEFNFEALKEIVNSDKIKEVRYYGEIKEINDKLKSLGSKMKELSL